MDHWLLCRESNFGSDHGSRSDLLNRSFPEVREKMRQIAAATKSERRKIEVRLATAALAAAEKGFEKTGDDDDAAVAAEKS